jgi:pimeloyl-ACP methyl ester carboxylesterase
MSTGAETFAEIADGVWGAGDPSKPSLVVLHGWGGDGPTNFAFALEHLVLDWHVVAIDLPGHGRGPRDLAVGDLRVVTDHVAELMAVHCHEPVVVLGYSLGGAVAQDLWWRHRHLVAGLVLAATAAKLCPRGIERTAMRAFARLGGFSRPLWGALGVGGRAVLRLGANRGYDVANLTGLGELDGPTFQMLARAVADFDAEGFIGDVDVPVAVVICEDDRIVPTARQEHLADLVEAAHVARCPGGHLGFLRHPEVFADAVADAARAARSVTTPT